MTDLYVTWSEYHHKIESLAVKIYRSHWQFDTIVCLAKGGLRVGDILCRLYDKPLAVLFTASYGGKNNQERGTIRFAQHLSSIETIGDRILLVDDLVDSGISLAKSINWLKTKHHNIQEIRTAVIWYKSISAEIPDYYIEYLPNNPWIHQPFEAYEQVEISEFAAKFDPH
ncbi:MAG: phosphoribosyltransferase family protein [Cyanobacteria bacterium P01_C01_bin.72]